MKKIEKIDETRNFSRNLLDQIKYNDLMSEKYKKVCKCLDYVEHFLILASKVVVFQFLHLLHYFVFLLVV